MNKPGTLYVVATPIGNLEDITFRAIRILSEVDLIAAEDTRHSRKLLDRFEISTPLVSHHQHNEKTSGQRLLSRLERGQKIALICDAGTPAISDPGAVIVKAARDNGFDVVPVPGVSALTCALSVSGMDGDSISFQGFLPAKKSQRVKELKRLAQIRQCYVFYEAPHRIEKSVNDMAEVFGDETTACIGKELTKLHESIRTGSLREHIEWLGQSSEHKKGEFVIIVDSDGISVDQMMESADKVLHQLLAECSPRHAAAIAAELFGGGKNRLYKRALEIAQVQGGETFRK